MSSNIVTLFRQILQGSLCSYDISGRYINQIKFDLSVIYARTWLSEAIPHN